MLSDLLLVLFLLDVFCRAKSKSRYLIFDRHHTTIFDTRKTRKMRPEAPARPACISFRSVKYKTERKSKANMYFSRFIAASKNKWAHLSKSWQLPIITVTLFCWTHYKLITRLTHNMNNYFYFSWSLCAYNWTILLSQRLNLTGTKFIEDFNVQLVVFIGIETFTTNITCHI